MKWVKVSERLPDKSHNYHCKIEQFDGKGTYNDACYFHERLQKFIETNDSWDNPTIRKVIEWLDEFPSPLPQDIESWIKDEAEMYRNKYLPNGAVNLKLIGGGNGAKQFEYEKQIINEMLCDFATSLYQKLRLQHEEEVMRKQLTIERFTKTLIDYSEQIVKQDAEISKLKKQHEEEKLSWVRQFDDEINKVEKEISKLKEELGQLAICHDQNPNIT